MSFQRGRADYLALGDWNAVCYQCGRKRKASQLKRYWQGYYVCPEHWEIRQPQDFVRAVPDVQTPPWTQPMPGDVFEQNILNVSEDDLEAGTYAAEIVPPVGTVTSPGTIITIPTGVSVTELDLGSPAEGEIIQINVEGYLGNISNVGNSTVIVRNLGGRFLWGVYGLIYEEGELVADFTDSTTIIITGGTDLNVFTLAQAQKSDAATTAYTWLILVIGTVYGTSSLDGALSMGGTWPAGSNFILINYDRIIGYGGAGGNGGVLALDGSDGGTALDLFANNVTVDNSNGYIFGGGGGGGNGGFAQFTLRNGDQGIFNYGGNISNAGGAGGGGAGPSSGGSAGTTTATLTQAGLSATILGDNPRTAVGFSTSFITTGTHPDPTVSVTISTIATAGTDGTTEGAGEGGIGALTEGINYDAVDGESSAYGIGGVGGAGGDFGEAGESGTTGSAEIVNGGTTSTGSAGVGGAGGYAVFLNGGTITWIAGNTEERVKGTVGD